MKILLRVLLYAALALGVLTTSGHLAATNNYQPLTGCLATTAADIADELGVTGVEFVATHGHPDGRAFVATNRPNQVVLDLDDVADWCDEPGWHPNLREVIAHELGHVAQYRVAGAVDARWGGAPASVVATLIFLPRLQDQLAEAMPDGVGGMDALEASADCTSEVAGMRVGPGYGHECSPEMLADAARILEAGAHP